MYMLRAIGGTPLPHRRRPDGGQPLQDRQERAVRRPSRRPRRPPLEAAATAHDEATGPPLARRPPGARSPSSPPSPSSSAAWSRSSRSTSSSPTCPPSPAVKPYTPLELLGPRHLHPRRLRRLPLADGPALPLRDRALRRVLQGRRVRLRPSVPLGLEAHRSRPAPRRRQVPRCLALQPHGEPGQHVAAARSCRPTPGC